MPRGARPIGETEEVPTDTFDFPFLIYYRPVIPIRFYQLNPEVAREVSASIEMSNSAEEPH